MSLASTPVDGAKAHHPATARQYAYIARLAEQLDADERYGAHAEVAVACGYTETLCSVDGTPVRDITTGASVVIEDMRAWEASWDFRTSGEASALIKAMQVIAAVPRAECYCRRRGRSCQTVRYWADHYDYSCGLS